MNIRASLALSYAQKYTSILLQFVSMVVIARLMTPGEVGEFALGAAFVAVAVAVSELGQSEYLIQAHTVTARQRQTALGVACVCSWSLALLVAVSTPLAIPADQIQVRRVIYALALAIALSPLSLLLRAHLLRDLKFSHLYAVNVTKDIALTLGGIGFVWLGYGALGLALGMLLEQITLLAWALRYHHQTGWVRPALSGGRELIRFGCLRTATYGLSALGDSLSRLIIGWLLGTGALGLLNRAQKITTIFDKTILEGAMPVLLPYLSSEVRRGADIRGAVVRKAVMLGGLAWPFFLFLALAAEPLVILLLGEQWVDAVPVVRVLSVIGVVVPFGAGVFPFLTVMQLLRAYLPLQVVTQVIVVVVALLGSLVSLELACASLVIGQLLKAMMSLYLIQRTAGTKLRILLPCLRANGGLTAACGAAVFLIVQLPLQAPLLGLLAIAGFAMTWLIGIYASSHPLAAELTRLVRAPSNGDVAAKVAEH